MVKNQLSAVGVGMTRKSQVRGGRLCCLGCRFLSCRGRKWSSLRVSCAWPSSSCSASLTGVAKTLNWCSIFWRVLLSVRFPKGFVDSVVKLGRLRELKFWVRLSLESRLVVG